jgi:hypothetical protein
VALTQTGGPAQIGSGIPGPGMPPYTKKLLTWSFTIAVIPPIVLIAVLATKSLYLLDYVHVICGGTWTGFDLYMGLVMSRILRSLDVTARVEIAKRLTPTTFFIISLSRRRGCNRRHLSRTGRGKVRFEFALDNSGRNRSTGTHCRGVRCLHAKWRSDIHRTCKVKTRFEQDCKVEHAQHSSGGQPGSLSSYHNSNHGTFSDILRESF